MWEGASEVEDENAEGAEGSASGGTTRAGEEAGAVSAETPSQTIDRVEAFMRWLCQVRRGRCSSISFSPDAACFAIVLFSGRRFCHGRDEVVGLPAKCCMAANSTRGRVLL